MSSSQHPEIRISVEKGKADQSVYSFTGPFKIGRDAECEVRLDNSKVSRVHAEVRPVRGKWVLEDLQSTNGAFVDGVRVEKFEITSGMKVSFGVDGPVLAFSIRQPADQSKPRTDLTPEEFKKHYFENRTDHDIGAHTMMIRSVFGQIQKKQKRKFRIVIFVLAILAVGAGGFGWWKHVESNKQKALAEDIFYAIKSQEVEFADLLRFARQSKDAQVLEYVKKYQAKKAENEKKYDEFLKRLDVYGKGKSREELAILTIARTFGECEVAMPEPFVQEVKNYINKWKSTPRLIRSLETARKNNYIGKIAEEFQTQGLPPQFLYLGLVESSFNLQACGPPTRFGIAKGMWQFIPTTARSYGLRTGPLAELPQFDPEDERHDLQKSTRAAAEYIRYIYDTEAQASGLLVMASYNWGENRVIKLINTMPSNPRERNFWCLLSKYRSNIPQETYDYVFYIVAAAVICENPRIFGFDFDNPLAQYKR